MNLVKTNHKPSGGWKREKRWEAEMEVGVCEGL
jgi:hypothetical protein